MSKDSGMRAPPRSGGTIRGACGPPRSRYETDSQYEGRSTFWHHSIFILRGAAQRHGSLRSQEGVLGTVSTLEGQAVTPYLRGDGRPLPCTRRSRPASAEGPV